MAELQLHVRVSLLLGVAIFCPMFSRADDMEIEFQENIVYGTGNGRELTLNLARPRLGRAENRPLPAVVVIHGGGWAAGDKKGHDQQIRDFARRGYVAATIGYRLVPEARFPAQIEDCKCAVRYLRAHASQWGIDAQRVGAIGFSAGAHLAMMLGTMDAQDGLEGEGGWPDQSSKVQAVVAFFGPTDFTREYPETSRQIVRNFLDGTLEDKPDVYRRASPITYVNAGDAPVLIFQGTKDPLVPHEQAILMAEKLTEAGITGRVEILLGASHGWGGAELERTITAYHDFFDKQLNDGR